MLYRLILFGWLTAFGFAQTDGVTVTAADVDKYLPIDDWFIFSVAGMSMGYINITIMEDERDGQPVIIYRTRNKLSLAVLTEEKSALEMDQEFIFDPTPPYRLRAYQQSTFETEPNMERKETERVRYTCEGDTCQLINELTPDSNDRTLAPLDFTLSDYLGYYVWLAQSPRQVGDKVIFQSISETEATLSTTPFEILERLEPTNEEGGPLRYRIATKDGDVPVIMIWDASPRPLEYHVMGMKGILGTKEEALAAFDLKPVERGGDLDKPIENIPRITKLQLGFENPNGEITMPNTPRQSLETDAATGFSTLTMVKPSGKGLPATAEEIQTAREERELSEPSTKKLKEWLATIEAKDGSASIRSILSFIQPYAVGEKRVEDLGLPDMFDDGEPTRDEIIDLFQGLALQADIVSRRIYGLLYQPLNNRFEPYVWAEYHEDGAWHEIDPILNMDRVTVVHLRTGHQPEAFASMLVLNRKPIKVMSIEHDQPAENPAAGNTVVHTIGEYGATISLDKGFTVNDTGHGPTMSQFISQRGKVITIREFPNLVTSAEGQRMMLEGFVAAFGAAKMEPLYQSAGQRNGWDLVRQGVRLTTEEQAYTMDASLLSKGPLHYLVLTMDILNNTAGLEQAGNRNLDALSLPDPNDIQFQTMETYTFEDEYSQFSMEYPLGILFPIEGDEFMFGMSDGLEFAGLYFFWAEDNSTLAELQQSVQDTLNEALPTLEVSDARELTFNGFPARHVTLKQKDGDYEVISLLIRFPRDEYGEFRYVGHRLWTPYRDIFDKIVESAVIRYSETETPEE